MSNRVYGNENFRPVHIRDCFLFERGNVKNFATQGGETGTSEVISANSNPGARPDVPCVIGVYSCFGEAAQPGNIRSVDVEQLFNYSAVTDITAGQSVAAIRGAQTHAEGTSFGSGTANEYSYGVQGKINIATKIKADEGFVAALFGQLDLSNNSADAESGYISALHLDLGATMGTGMDSDALAFVNAETITNTTGALVNSIIKVIADAANFMDLTDLANGGAHWLLSGKTASSFTSALKVKVGASTFYIPLGTSWA